MASNGHWIQKLAEGSQLYGESVPGVPIVEIAGDCRVLIERHDGVVEYDTQRIRVRTAYGIVCIIGCNMMLKQMTKQQLVITGRIDSVQIQRRCR